MKLAFCFMSYGDIVHADIWHRFFQDASSDQFITCLHRVDGILSSSLPNCTVIPTQPTAWGKFSLVEVQQALFEEACKDPDVFKCILVSGDSIPLYPFKYIWEKLCADDKGYMHYIRGYPNRRRIKGRFKLGSSGDGYNLTTWPKERAFVRSITYQWCILNREHVQKLSSEFLMLSQVFGNSVIPDEHVYSIFFESINMLETFVLKAPMWIMWKGKIENCSISHRNRPMTFHTNDFSVDLVNKIYSEKGLFMRKLCSNTVLNIDWTRKQMILPSTVLSSSRPNTLAVQEPVQGSDQEPDQESVRDSVKRLPRQKFRHRRFILN